MSNLFDERDSRFLEMKTKLPTLTYAQYKADIALTSIRNGNNHATLGPKLRKHADWWQAGQRTFERLRHLCSLADGNRVVDYGCGSLRVGAHFIKFLKPERYFGLDVTNGFIEMGLDLMGPDIYRQKRPRLEAINERSLAAATSFQADIVYSTAVSYHVHPSEVDGYYRNLARLTSKPGARLLFDASISDVPLRNRSWCWPLSFYIQSLSELEFVQMHGGTRRAQGANYSIGFLEFRRR